MSSRLNYPAVIKNYDLVAVPYCGQSVGYNYNSDAPLCYRCNYIMLRHCIKRTCCLIEYYYCRILRKYSGNFHSLSLSSGKILPALKDPVSVTSVTLHDIFVDRSIS